MARTRNIKPGFYKNELLAECSILARYIFPGLWTLADRRGRLEDRPKRIKAELLPYDNGDMDALLGELARYGFIIRYEVDGVPLIQIATFNKNQQPNMKEQDSILPEPPGYVYVQGEYLPNEVLTPYEHGVNTVQEPDEHITSTPLNLKPYTLNPKPSDVGADAPPAPAPPQPIDNFTPFADEVWELYPDRRGKKLNKKKCYDELRRIPNRDWDMVLIGVQNFRLSKQALEGFAPDAFRWIRDGLWKDWQEPEKAPTGRAATRDAAGEWSGQDKWKQFISSRQGSA